MTSIEPNSSWHNELPQPSNISLLIAAVCAEEYVLNCTTLGIGCFAKWLREGIKFNLALSRPPLQIFCVSPPLKLSNGRFKQAVATSAPSIKSLLLLFQYVDSCGLQYVLQWLREGISSISLYRGPFANLLRSPQPLYYCRTVDSNK